MTSVLIKSFFHWKLANYGFPPCETAELDERLSSVMQHLCSEFESRYRHRYQPMCDQLIMTEANAESTFYSVADELFTDGIKWGRVVALFCFSGWVAKQLANQGMIAHALQVPTWLEKYINSNLGQWIEEHNGWDGFISHFEDKKRRISWSWQSIGQVAGLALGMCSVFFFL